MLQPPHQGRSSPTAAAGAAQPPASRSCSISRQGSDAGASLDGSELSGAPAHIAWGAPRRPAAHSPLGGPAHGPAAAAASAAVAVIAAGAAAAAAAASRASASFSTVAAPLPAVTAGPMTWAARLAGGSRTPSPVPHSAVPQLQPQPVSRAATPQLPMPAARGPAGAPLQSKTGGPSWAAAVAGTVSVPAHTSASGTITPAQRLEERTPFARAGSPPSQPSSLSAETQSSGVQSPPSGFRAAPVPAPLGGGSASDGGGGGGGGVGGQQCPSCRAARAEAAAAVMGAAAVHHRAVQLEEQVLTPFTAP